MKNIGIKIEGKILVLRIDMSLKGTPSASGKSLVIATTSGNVEVPGMPGVKLGVNCYKAAQ